VIVAQGFEAVGMIFCLLFIESRSFRDHELTSLIHAIFSDEKIARPFSFFSFSSKRKEKRKRKIPAGTGYLSLRAGRKT
jgi:hypothetical protein